MTIEKYRNVHEMPPVVRVASKDLARRIRTVWVRTRRLVDASFAPGVQKFTDIEAAHWAREQAVKNRVRRLREQRHKYPKPTPSPH